MDARRQRWPVRFAARVALVGALAWAWPALAAVPFALPPGESAAEWTVPLGLAGFAAGTGGGGARVKVTAAGARWTVEVTDERGGVHVVTVDRPTTARAREDLVWLAQSLVHPAPSLLSALPTSPPAATPAPPAPPPATPATPTTPAATRPPTPPAARPPVRAATSPAATTATGTSPAGTSATGATTVRTTSGASAGGSASPTTATGAGSASGSPAPSSGPTAASSPASSSPVGFAPVAATPTEGAPVASGAPEAGSPGSGAASPSDSLGSPPTALASPSSPATTVPPADPAVPAPPPAGTALPPADGVAAPAALPAGEPDLTASLDTSPDPRALARLDVRWWPEVGAGGGMAVRPGAPVAGDASLRVAARRTGGLGVVAVVEGPGRSVPDVLVGKGTLWGGFAGLGAGWMSDAGVSAGLEGGVGASAHYLAYAADLGFDPSTSGLSVSPALWVAPRIAARLVGPLVLTLDARAGVDLYEIAFYVYDADTGEASGRGSLSRGWAAPSIALSWSP